jgi:hypothetical protein
MAKYKHLPREQENIPGKITADENQVDDHPEPDPDNEANDPTGD